MSSSLCCWRHLPFPGDAPARSLAALAHGLASRKPNVATIVTPLEEEPAHAGGRPSRRGGLPPFAHDGTEQADRPAQDPVEQQESYSGKKRDHTVKNVLLVNALLVILFLSDTHGGRVHDLRIAEATPYPLPAGSGLLQDWASCPSRSLKWES